MTRIFLTGASGYIGGDFLHVLQKEHPEYDVAVLVRDKQKGEKILESYPNVRLVLGDLDSADLLKEEASKADIVVHVAHAKHYGSVKAIAEGLQSASHDKSSYWIQVSGATLLAAPEIVNHSYGQAPQRKYGDIDDLDDIKNLAHEYASQRMVDDYIIGLQHSQTKIKTALVVPPIIYGTGRGPVNQRSVQIPELARATLQKKAGIQVGDGLSVWSNIHIADLSQIFLALVEKAVSKENGPFWNEDGLYFAENGALSFREIAQLITREAHKLKILDEPGTIQTLTAHDADSLSPHAGVLWGTNAYCQSHRARKCLGWSPTHTSLEEEIQNTLRIEAIRLGLL